MLYCCLSKIYCIVAMGNFTKRSAVKNSGRDMHGFLGCSVCRNIINLPYEERVVVHGCAYKLVLSCRNRNGI